MTDESPAADPFIIVNLTASKEAAGVRKKIRSRAARHSHEVGRKNRKFFDGVQQHELLLRPESRALLSSSSSSSSSELVTPPIHTLPPLPESPPNESSITRCEHGRHGEKCCTSKGKAVAGVTRTDSPPQRNVLQYAGPRLVHDGLVYPVPEQWFFARVIKFMWQWIPAAWQILDVTDNDREEALPWVQRLTMSSPPYFYINMLSAATTLVSQGQLPADLIPWLMTQTVRAINEALSRPETMLEVGVILAVGRIALRECMRGAFSTGATIHRPAQARMLAMAGGLEALAIPHLVKEHILWGERLVIAKTGVALTDLHPGALQQPSAMVATKTDNMLLKAYYLEDQRTTDVSD